MCDDEDPERPTTPCQPQPTDDVIQSKASLSSDAVEDDVDLTADDNDDIGPCDSDAVTANDAFPLKPPKNTVVASCPPSPPSDIVRTSAEGMTCDCDERHRGGVMSAISTVRHREDQC